VYALGRHTGLPLPYNNETTHLKRWVKFTWERSDVGFRAV
jgi:hypothetical protein